MLRAKSWAAALSAGAVVTAQSCSPSNTVTSTYNSTYSVPGSTTTVTIGESSTTTTTITSTITPSSTLYTSGPGYYDTTVFTDCPASTVSGQPTSYGPPYTFTVPISEAAVPTYRYKRQVEGNLLDTVVLYTCLATSNGTAPPTFVPGPTGTSNPNGPITVTLSPEQASTSILTTTFSDGSIWYVTEELVRTTYLGGAVSIITIPIAVSKVPAPGASTTTYTTTLSDGTVEVITDLAHLYRNAGGAVTSTRLEPVGTSIVSPPSARTTSYTTTLQDGTVETVYESLIPALLGGGTLSTATIPYATTVDAGSTSTTQYTTTARGGVVEVITDALYKSVLLNGTTVTVSRAIGTSVVSKITSPALSSSASSSLSSAPSSLSPSSGSSSASPSSGSSSSASGSVSTSVIALVQETTDANGQPTTFTATYGTLTFPPAVGSTSTTVIQATFAPSYSGYVAGRYYVTTNTDDGSSATVVETLGSFIVGPGAATIAESNVASTSVISTTLSDGTQEFTTQAYHGSVGSDGVVTPTASDGIATLIIAPGSSSTSLATITTAVSGTTSVVAEAIFTTTDDSGDLSIATQPLGTFVVDSATSSCSDATITVTATVPGAAATVAAFTATTASTDVSTSTITTTVTGIDTTQTITASYSTTLSIESYYGVYTAAVQDVNSYYPVLDLYRNLDFPFGDIPTNDPSDTRCVCGSVDCFGTGEPSCNDLDGLSCLETCIKYNNVNPSSTQPCVAFSYEPLHTGYCWLKFAVPPNAVVTIGQDTCGEVNKYESYSGVIRANTQNQAYPSVEAPNTGDNSTQNGAGAYYVYPNTPPPTYATSKKRSSFFPDAAALLS